jgi:hypothetical protein
LRPDEIVLMNDLSKVAGVREGDRSAGRPDHLPAALQP